MSGRSAAEDHDDTPKSVSALLSRFENKTVPGKPALAEPAHQPMTASKPPPKPKPKPQLLQARPSLDIDLTPSGPSSKHPTEVSRTPSPSSTPLTPNGSRAPPPLPRPRRQAASAVEKKRLSSFVPPTSPVRTVPVVDVSSPKSPQIVQRDQDHGNIPPAGLGRIDQHPPRQSSRSPHEDIFKDVPQPIPYAAPLHPHQLTSSLPEHRSHSQSPAPLFNRGSKPAPSPKGLPRLDTTSSRDQSEESTSLTSSRPPSYHGGSAKIPSRTARLSASRESSPQRGRSSPNDVPEARPILPPRRVVTPVAHQLTPQARPSALTQGFSNTVPTTRSSNATPIRSSGYTQTKHRSNSSIARPSVDLPRPSLSRTQSAAHSAVQRGAFDGGDAVPSSASPAAPTAAEYPDCSRVNRRVPSTTIGPKTFATGYDPRLVDVRGEYVCASGTMTRVWNMATGRLVFGNVHGENVKVTAIKFRPSRDIAEEGQYIWIGTNWGEMQEIDIVNKRVTGSNTAHHAHKEVIRILCRGTEVWTIDQEGKLFVWPPDEAGTPNLDYAVQNARVPRGHTCAAVVGNMLWVANGRELRVYEPTNDPKRAAMQHAGPMSQSNTGEITCCTTTPADPDKVYFGHTDGKVSVYSGRSLQCLSVHNISQHRIHCLLGVGHHIWTGNSLGWIYVYDPRPSPWRMKKEWPGHSHSVISLKSDEEAAWKLDRVQVVSLSSDYNIGIWDGLLQVDWMNEWMEGRKADFCTFEDLSALVLTWNAGASKPGDLRYDEQDSNFFRDILHTHKSPDIIVFGLQELVDLEDKKLTAKSFFKGKHKDAYGREELSSAYREWRDYLKGCLYDSTSNSNAYELVHSASLVGLFSCVFIKKAHQWRMRCLNANEVKTGMGGLHGNKGALVVRFLLNDTSLCFVNCHLAAGQNATSNRNNDAAAILESHALPDIHSHGKAKTEVLTSGGDGSMILDHEICILNGDLNYRIDAIGREACISAIKQGNLKKLLDRDQLQLSRQKVAGLRLRAFKEGPIEFAPTYKYDVGTDQYDTSEKRRAPAWCDRILWRGDGVVTQRTYERHEVRVSDHRPVTSRFKLRIKTIDSNLRASVWKEGEAGFEMFRRKASDDIRLRYLQRTFALSESEARKELRH